MEKNIDEKINERLRLSYLIARKQLNALTDKENEELVRMVERDNHLKELSQHILSQTSQDNPQEDALTDADIDLHWKEFKKAYIGTSDKQSPRIPHLRMAASIAAIAAMICGILFLTDPSAPTKEAKEINIAKKSDLNTIIATTESRGFEMYAPPTYQMDYQNLEAKVGMVSEQDFCSPQTFHMLSPSIANSCQSLLREASTGAGGCFDVVMSDKSVISLNQCTTLRYLAKFDTNKREIWMKEGEAFFHVKHDEKREFQVHIGKLTVCVLGTEFNISAYPESPVKITLISGSVKIKTPEGEQLLQPNETATYLNGQLDIEIKDNDEILAWTQNKFYFKGSSLKEITEAVAKWYGLKLRCLDEETMQQIAFLDCDRRYAPFHVLQNIELQNSELMICYKLVNKEEVVAYSVSKDDYYRFKN